MCTIMLVCSGQWVFIFPCTVMVFFFSLNSFSSGEISLFFRCIYRRCLVCICPFITLVSCSVYFGGWIPGNFLAGRVMFSFCVGLRCVECRAGTIYLSVSLGWVAGLYRFFLLLGSVVVGTVRLKCGRVWSVFLAFFSLLSVLLAGGCLW